MGLEGNVGRGQQISKREVMGERQENRRGGLSLAFGVWGGGMHIAWGKLNVEGKSKQIGQWSFVSCFIPILSSAQFSRTSGSLLRPCPPALPAHIQLPTEQCPDSQAGGCSVIRLALRQRNISW